ncbi:hypothetical protein JCM19241_3128 [Vibrio ishigakensis]|uniref:Metal-binding protein n=1 Tax=Vibrio ishigakensis TaxID=1481914 RepID=A0A0B8QES4_9VIBR|nr:hypothetical protein JCM19241_3128 [Vibrio ishigakensis]
MKSVNKIVLSVSLLFTSLSYAAKFDVEMYKSPQCGCCTEWAEILEQKATKWRFMSKINGMM